MIPTPTTLSSRVETAHWMKLKGPGTTAIDQPTCTQPTHMHVLVCRIIQEDTLIGLKIYQFSMFSCYASYLFFGF